MLGLASLLIVTFRTLVAFTSDSKAVIININTYGEQYFDIVALVIIWIISLISFFYLIKVFKEEESLEKKPTFELKDNYLGLNPRIKLNNKKSTFFGYFSKSNFNKKKNL